jgi:hypothetical protein
MHPAYLGPFSKRLFVVPALYTVCFYLQWTHESFGSAPSHRRVRCCCWKISASDELKSLSVSVQQALYRCTCVRSAVVAVTHQETTTAGSQRQGVAEASLFSNHGCQNESLLVVFAVDLLYVHCSFQVAEDIGPPLPHKE